MDGWKRREIREGHFVSFQGKPGMANEVCGRSSIGLDHLGT